MYLRKGGGILEGARGGEGKGEGVLIDVASWSFRRLHRGIIIFW